MPVDWAACLVNGWYASWLGAGAYGITRNAYDRFPPRWRRDELRRLARASLASAVTSDDSADDTFALVVVEQETHPLWNIATGIGTKRYPRKRLLQSLTFGTDFNQSLNGVPELPVPIQVEEVAYQDKDHQRLVQVDGATNPSCSQTHSSRSVPKT